MGLCPSLALILGLLIIIIFSFMIMVGSKNFGVWTFIVLVTSFIVLAYSGVVRPISNFMECPAPKETAPLPPPLVAPPTPQ